MAGIASLPRVWPAESAVQSSPCQCLGRNLTLSNPPCTGNTHACSQIGVKAFDPFIRLLPDLRAVKGGWGRGGGPLPVLRAARPMTQRRPRAWGGHPVFAALLSLLLLSFLLAMAATPAGASLPNQFLSDPDNTPDPTTQPAFASLLQAAGPAIRPLILAAAATAGPHHPIGTDTGDLMRFFASVLGDSEDLMRPARAVRSQLSTSNVPHRRLPVFLIPSLIGVSEINIVEII